MGGRGTLNVLELLKKVAQGDEVAFKWIYECYFSKIQAFAFRVIHNHEHAQDVAQEVMLVIWQMGEKLNGIKNLDDFLKTLTKRRTIDMLRHLQIERTAEQAMRVKRTVINEETEDQIVLNETSQIIEDSICLLPARQRTVYQLCQQQGLKYEEAARRLDISPGTVQTHMKLALRSLRSHLRKRMDLPVLLVIFGLFR